MRYLKRIGKLRGRWVPVTVAVLPNNLGYEAFVPGVTMMAAYADTVEEAVDACTVFA